MNRRPLLLLLSLGVVAILAGAGLARMFATPAVSLDTGTWLPQPRPLAAFHLQDLAGHDFSTASLKGHPTLLFFGFTHCPDVCPTTLSSLAELQRLHPVPDTQVVFVSIDPERDSAAQLAVYLGYFDHNFIGVRGDQAALAPMLKSLNAIAVRENLPDGSYTMDHSATLYLLDRNGQLVAVFSPPFVAPRLAADLQRLGASHRL
jgi:protein SCO1